jgi:hypothetical protein
MTFLKPKILFTIVMLLLVSSCRTPVESATSEEESMNSVIAGEGLENLIPDLEIRYLGSYTKENPNAHFFTSEESNALFGELWKAFAGKSDEFKFLYCEGRSIYPETEVIKECSSVLGFKETTVQFSFLAYDIKTSKKCYLGSLDCRIHQTVTVKAANDGIQRPPVFIHEKPIAEKILLMTNRVIQPENPGFLGFLTKFLFAKDIFAPIVMTPYNFSKGFGRDLGSLLGSCNTQVMNLVDFSSRAFKYYKDYRKPVVLSGIAANASFNAGMIMFGLGAPARFKTAMLANKNLMAAGAKTPTEALKIRMMPLVKAKDSIFLVAESGGFVPYIVSDILNLENNLSQYKAGSPSRRAMEASLLLTSFLTASGFSQLGYGMSKATAKNWKLMAVSLSSLAVGGSLYCVRGGPENCKDRLHIAEEKIKSLANLLSQGNAPEAKKALCEMQVDAGLRKTCPPISAISNFCKG